jgi:exodeoxyribonuclease VII small subunit
MSESSTPPQDAKLSFEDSMRRLTAIVERLERGDLPLEQSIELFEEGMRIARQSRDALEKAEKRVEELLAVEADGTPVTRPLATD